MIAFAALALPVSAEEPGEVIALDFVPGWEMSDGVAMGGLRIRLEPGWRTYWRSPGDAGIPPHFTWAGSENLRAVRIHWPRPEVFDTAGYRTLGYSGQVVLPVEIFARDPEAPVSVAGEVSLGVCRDICLPAEVRFASAPEDGRDHTTAIRTALGDRPQPIRDATVNCAVEPIRDGLQLTARATLPAQGGDEIAVIEVERSDIWVSEVRTARKGGVLEMRADLVPPDAAPFALDRSSVRMTVLGRDGAVELSGCAAG